jgi:hypothetical protein
MKKKLILQKSNLIFKLIIPILFIFVKDSSLASEIIYIKDLQGIWISEKYIKQLENNKNPLETYKNQKPNMIVIKRDGSGYPIIITNMNKIFLQIAIAIEGTDKQDTLRIAMSDSNSPINSNEVKFLYLKGIKEPNKTLKKIQFKESFISKKWINYLNIGNSLGPFINRLVLSGEYEDQNNKKWNFRDDGTGSSPVKGNFYYELNLSGKNGDCNFIEIEDLLSADGKRRLGFIWKNNKLVLFNAKIKNSKVICEDKPYKILLPR